MTSTFGKYKDSGIIEALDVIFNNYPNTKITVNDGYYNDKGILIEESRGSLFINENIIELLKVKSILEYKKYNNKEHI